MIQLFVWSKYVCVCVCETMGLLVYVWFLCWWGGERVCRDLQCHSRSECHSVYLKIYHDTFLHLNVDLCCIFCWVMRWHYPQFFQGCSNSEKYIILLKDFMCHRNLQEKDSAESAKRDDKTQHEYNFNTLPRFLNAVLFHNDRFSSAMVVVKQWRQALLWFYTLSFILFLFVFIVLLCQWLQQLLQILNWFNGTD